MSAGAGEDEDEHSHWQFLVGNQSLYMALVMACRWSWEGNFLVVSLEIGRHKVLVTAPAMVTGRSDSSDSG